MKKAPQKKTTKAVKKAAPVSVRLSKFVTPIRYEITLKPDLEAHVFEGTETIAIELAKPAKEITLHSKDLEILSASITVGKKELSADAISYDEHAETATFHFAEKLPAGKAKLTLIFTGILADTMRGFYKSRYMVDDKERFMAVTQFEATDARRAFPCFDEPAQKAVFDVHLVVPNDRTAISNTLPVATREHGAGFTIVSFAPTPKMSTYLLAFMVGDFEFIEAKTNRGVLVRIATVPGKKEQGRFALDVTVRCLEFYEQYFAIPYPLNTLDMIAIPDFSSLAMENWGAITFREIGLLVDDKNTSTASRQMVALVIAHELAHQWFGNLVTMEWWTHLWLNEGFATYIEHLAVDALFPEYGIWMQFVTAMSGHGLANALKFDALKHTHPVEVEVHHPNEIGEVFDIVSYDKGASIIRMLSEYVGEKAFRDSLRYYLKQHSYKNASTVHLWEAFEKVSKKPVKKMMAVWTGKSGYPLLSVSTDGKKLTLKQKRYYSSVASSKNSKDTTTWPIPLLMATEKGEKSFDLMTKKSTSMPLPKAEWVKFNAHEGSVYRTHDEGALLGSLVAPISTGAMGPADRLGIIRDLFGLAEAGEIDTTTVLEMLSVYKDEKEYAVWVEIISGLRYIANLLHGSDSYEAFRAYARSIVSGIAQHVGWEAKKDESDDQAMLRPLALGAASFYGDLAVTSEALLRFNNRSEKQVHPDVRGVVYVTAAREGKEKEYEELLAMHRAETLHEEKERLLGALGSFRSEKLLSRTLAMIMTEEVRMQDRNRGFASVLVNPAGRTLGWKVLKKNWKNIGEAYGEGNHLLSRLVAVLNRNTTKEAYDDIKTFFKTHSAPAAERAVEQVLENVDSNVRWLKRDEKKISKWLKENK